MFRDHHCAHLAGYVHTVLNAGIHLFIAYPAVNEIPHPNIESRMLTLTAGVDRLPDKLTYKLTYPVKGHSQEGALFSQFDDQFGVADVIGYHACGTEVLRNA